MSVISLSLHELRAKRNSYIVANKDATQNTPEIYVPGLL